MMDQKTEVNKIDTYSIRDKIAQAVSEINMSMGQLINNEEVVGRFPSKVAFEHEGEMVQGIIEISLNTKLLAPHLGRQEFEEARAELDKQ